MAILSNQQLLNRLVSAVSASGWIAQQNVAYGKKPFTMFIYQGSQYLDLNVYIWNLSHGGYPRSGDEYRIQIKERTGLHHRPDAKNLLLGWWDEVGVFAGFDFKRHVSAAYSASVQIRRGTLVEAITTGIATQNRGNGEIAVAIRPDLFVEYVRNLEIFHAIQPTEQDIQVMQQVITGVAEPTLQFPAEISIERQRILRTIHQNLRDSSFRRRVLSVYEHRCALCGLQLDLVDAAHIVPVNVQDATDATSNGIALCALHHRAYDASLVSFTQEYRVMYNQKLFEMLHTARRDGGKETFLRNLRPIIHLPTQDLPSRDNIIRANTLRGWRDVDVAFIN